MSNKKQQTPWEKAKKVLIQCYSVGKINDETKAEDIHRWEEFKEVPFRNFKPNHERLKANGFKANQKSPWTMAKPYIEQAYLNGAITQDMSSEDVRLLLQDELLEGEFKMWAIRN